MGKKNVWRQNVQTLFLIKKTKKIPWFNEKLCLYVFHTVNTPFIFAIAHIFLLKDTDNSQKEYFRENIHTLTMYDNLKH